MIAPPKSSSPRRNGVWNYDIPLTCTACSESHLLILPPRRAKSIEMAQQSTRFLTGVGSLFLGQGWGYHLQNCPIRWELASSVIVSLWYALVIPSCIFRYHLQGEPSPLRCCYFSCFILGASQRWPSSHEVVSAALVHQKVELPMRYTCATRDISMVHTLYLRIMSRDSTSRGSESIERRWCRPMHLTDTLSIWPYRSWWYEHRVAFDPRNPLYWAYWHLCRQ